MPADTEIKHLQLRLLLLEILLVLASKWTRPTRLADLGADAYARINRALNLVFENRRMITGQEAARACGMGRNTFTHVFKSLMGIHFPDFALRYRLNAAAGELLATDEPVKAVARNWGFTDSSHLHRCFQTHYGCSPGQYRKRKNFG